MWPGSRVASLRSSKTCETRPMSRIATVRSPSETAIPADSCPRCCSAYSPKWARCASSPESSREYSPKTPQASFGFSVSPKLPNLASLRSVPLEQVPLVSLLDLIERKVHEPHHLQPLPVGTSNQRVVHTLQMLLKLHKPRLRYREQDAPPALPKEGHVLPTTGKQLHLCPDTGLASERHLGERNRQDATREVVGRIYYTCRDGSPYRVRDRPLGHEIRHGRRAVGPTVHHLPIV